MVSVKNNAQGREKKKREINGLYRNTRTAALVREEEKEIECTEAERERKKKRGGRHVREQKLSVRVELSFFRLAGPCFLHFFIHHWRRMNWWFNGYKFDKNAINVCLDLEILYRKFFIRFSFTCVWTQYRIFLSYWITSQLGRFYLILF